MNIFKKILDQDWTRSLKEEAEQYDNNYLNNTDKELTVDILQKLAQAQKQVKESKEINISSSSL